MEAIDVYHIQEYLNEAASEGFRLSHVVGLGNSVVCVMEKHKRAGRTSNHSRPQVRRPRRAPEGSLGVRPGSPTSDVAKP
jgi:hypothetical protein